MTKTLWMDISTIYRWSGPVAGIIRTELECARYLLESNDRARFCRYRPNREIYQEVSRNEVKSIVRRIDSGTVFERSLKKLVKNVTRYLSPKNQEKTDDLLYWIIRIVKGAGRRLNKPASNIIGILTRLFGRGEGVRFSAGDVYITLGLDWDDKNLPVLYDIKKRTGIKVLGVCYDIIPVKHPGFSFNRTFEFYQSYFTDLARCADTILCISENTRKDLARFLESINGPRPRLGLIRLGSEIDKKAGPISHTVRHVSEKPFILYVSTIERRKNHEILYRAYTRLVESGKTDLPRLVFVGRKGLGVDDFLSDLRLDPRIQGLILQIDRVTDAELDFLYRNTLFTVFPSLYEGWGLPVAESLDHGKFCIASNTSSLPEVGGRFVDYLDPWDLLGWSERITYYISNPAELSKKEENIQKRHKPCSWSETIRSLVDEAMGL